MTERTPPRGNLTRALAKRMRAEHQSAPPAAPSASAPAAAQLAAPPREDDTVPRIELPKAAARPPAPAPAPAPALAPRAPPELELEIEQRWDEDTPAPMWITADEERTSTRAASAEVPPPWSTLPPPVPVDPAEDRPAPAQVTQARPAPSKLAEAWPVIAPVTQSLVLDEEYPRPASSVGRKIGIVLAAGLLGAIAARALWPGALPMKVAHEPVAENAKPELSSAAAVTDREPVAGAPSAMPSLVMPSPEPPASVVPKEVDDSPPVRTERSERERSERDLDEAAAPPAATQARADQPSDGSTPAATTAAASGGVLRLTPTAVARPAPAARAESPGPTPSAATQAAAQASPAARAPAAPARGPSREAILIEQIAPKFPPRARRMGVTEGTVTIEYTIDKVGAVKDAVVVSANPPGIFDDAALGAIQRWRFQPKLQDGKPVETRRRFKATFQ